MKPFLIVYFFYLTLSQINFSQSLSSKIFHPLSNAFGITVEAGGTIPKTDYKLDELDIAGRILLEYYFTSRSVHAFGLRLLGYGGFVQGEVFSNDLTYPPVPDNFRTGFLSLGGGLVYALRLGNGVPYISVAAAYTIFDPRDNSGYQLPNNEYSIYKNETVLYSGEAGIRFPFGDVWSLNLGVDINFSNTDYFDDIEAGNNNDAFISFFTGVSFYLGKNIDKDNDGIDDDIDLCPDTPEGNNVDEFGCSVTDLSPQVAVYDSLKDNFISNGIFTDGTLFCFQVEIFKSIKDAEKLQIKIITYGYKSNIFSMNIEKCVWYSVRVGFYNSLQEAKLFKEIFFKKTRLKLKY